MEIEFLNGSVLQKAVVRDALRHLMNLPLESVPISTMEVEFTADPSIRVHNEFMVTLWTYDSGSILVKIRDDFPSFQSPYNGRRFAEESVAHEFGHGMFANIGRARRLKVLRMFGATTDDPDVVGDQSKPWEDRVGEGIAETFKDAFFPPSMRRYSNRTHRHIPIWEYGRFRAIFRNTGAGIGFNYVYGSNSFRVDKSAYGFFPPLHQSNRDDEAFVYYRENENFSPWWGVDMSQFKEATHMPFSIEEEGIITQ